MSAIRNVSVLQNLFCVTTGTASACVVLPPTTETPVCGGSESTASPAFGLWSSDGIPNSFGGVYLDSSSSWVTYDASSIWNDFNSLNSAIVSMQTKNAELQCEAGVASALSAYVTAFTTNYDAEALAAIDEAGAKLTSALNAKTAFNNALWNARGTAHSGYMTAISAADSTQNFLSYITSSVASENVYKSARANAYGDFQIANRQNKLDGTTASNPRRGAYQSDVAWAQQTKSLRNQYRIASGTATSDYYTTVANALTAYNTAALNAELTAAQNYFNAEKTYSQNVQGAYVGYAIADFAAAKAKALAYLTASTTQLTADYGIEAELAQSRASAYSLLLNNLQTTLDAADLTKFGTISTLKETFVHALASANAADDALADANATQLAAEKAQNEISYNEALAEADAAYQRAWQNAWNDAFLDVLDETAVEKTTFDTIINAMKTALGTAGNSYRDTVFAAYEDLSNEASNVAKIYAYNQSRIDQGGTVAYNAFENPTFDYEVCFVAGTQVLMADGTTKPIEQIRPGDMILAADHLNPEEEPTSASVVRFFDNGEKDVVKLVFEHAQEIVCTPTHRFYVIGKGWVHAQELQSEDLCLSEKGEKIAFVARENLEEKQRVYNFEVEKKHTYFVGVNSKKHILTHNDCPPLSTDDEWKPLGSLYIWVDAQTLPTEVHRKFDHVAVEKQLNEIFKGVLIVNVLLTTRPEETRKQFTDSLFGTGLFSNTFGDWVQWDQTTSLRGYHFFVTFNNDKWPHKVAQAGDDGCTVFSNTIGILDAHDPSIKDDYAGRLAIAYANVLAHEAVWHGLLGKPDETEAEDREFVSTIASSRTTVVISEEVKQEILERTKKVEK